MPIKKIGKSKPTPKKDIRKPSPNSKVFKDLKKMVKRGRRKG